MTSTPYHTHIVELLASHGWRLEDRSLVALAGDGSDRPFFRLRRQDGRRLLAAFPSPTLARARQEAEAAFHIGRHLRASGVPVPEIVAHDPGCGLILFEDLGDRLLFHAVQAEGWSALVFDLYRQAVRILAHMQLVAGQGFRSEWCWDTPRYDRELMISRESRYFAREFVSRYLGLSRLPAGLEADFVTLAERVGQSPSTYLMHRDYQSRNLMVVENELRVIDFQGARLGPLAYDLASLLNDPYVELPGPWREDLLRLYLQEAGHYSSLEPATFLADYPHVALQRNLQVLGAYAFLTLERGKEFFRPYIGPALRHLVALLSGPLAGDYPSLQGLVAGEACRRLLEPWPLCPST